MQLASEKSKALLATKKAIGTGLKVQDMIEKDTYCIDVIQQIDASIGHLKSVKKTLLQGHLDHCLVHKLKEDKKQAVTELMKIFHIES